MTFGLRIARWAWIGAAATMIALATMTVDDVWRSAGRIGPGPEYLNDARQYELSVSQVRALDDIGLSADWHAALVTTRFLLVLGSSAVIATLLWHRARTWAPLFVAWFLLLSPMFTVILDLDTTAAGIPAPLRPGVVALFAGGMISMLCLLLVFPDDSSAAWVIAFLVAASAAPLYAAATNSDALGDWLWNYGFVVVGVLVLGGFIVQVRRIVRSRDRTARDLLVVAVAALGAMMVLGGLADDIDRVIGSREGLGSLARRLIWESVFMAVPLGFGIAVMWILLRRGHWDMDIRLKGSVGYAALTTFLVVGYFGTVAFVQALVNSVSGTSNNTFGVMVSTALIAALFLPARARLQLVADRVFDRRRRDAERLVAKFELHAAREVVPGEVVGALLEAVDDIFRPEHADVWLAPDERT